MNTLLNTIVIGSDLSALTAALVSARHGKSTALIIEEDHPSSFSEKGYRFNSRSMTFGGINPEGILSHLLKALDLSLPQNTRTPPPLQVILPDNRITLFNDPDLLAQEIERELGIPSKTVRNLYDKAIPAIKASFAPKVKGETSTGKQKLFHPPLSNFRKLAGRGIISPLRFYKFKKHPALVDTFRGLSSVLANVESDTIDPPSLSYALLLLSKGIHPDGDDIGILIDRMREKFESLGGHIVKDCDIQTVSMGRSVSVDVKVGEETFVIDGESIIASAKWNKLSSALADDKRLSGLARQYRKSESSFLYPFTFFMGVRQKGIPEMMSETVIFLADKAQHFLKGNLLVMTRSPRDNTACAPEGGCALGITMFLEDPPRQLHDSVLRHFIHDSLDTLENFLPFLGESIDVIAEDNSILISRKYQDVINRKITVTNGISSEISLCSNRKHLKNIAITGGEFAPAVGIEGEIVSGIEAAEGIIGRLRG